MVISESQAVAWKSVNLSLKNHYSKLNSKSHYHGHEYRTMTEKVRSQVQASEMRFLQRIEEVTLFNMVSSSEIKKSLNIVPLLLRVDRFQLRWFGHVSRTPQKKLPKQVLAYFPKQMGNDQLDDLKLDRPLH